MPVPDAVGTPLVAALGAHYLLAFQRFVPTPTVSVVGHDPGGAPSALVDVQDGLLSALIVVGDSVHVISQSVDGSALTVGTIVFSIPSQPYPVPIGTERVLLPPGAASMATGPVALCTAGPSPTGTGWGLVAWRAGERIVGQFSLDESGLVGPPDFERGPNGSCEAILQAAGRRTALLPNSVSGR